MALLTRKEFCKLTGISKAHVSMYIKRGKIILSDDKYIDDSVRGNAEFIYSQLQKNKELVKVEAALPPVSVPDVDHSIQFEGENEEIAEAYQVKGSLDMQKKRREIEKLTEEIAILKVKKDKLHGIVIPTDLIKMSISRLTKSFLIEFSNTTEKIITEFTKIKGLTNEESSRFRSTVMSETNRGVDKAIDEFKKDIKNIVDEFSEKKGKGERK